MCPGRRAGTGTRGALAAVALVLLALAAGCGDVDSVRLYRAEKQFFQAKKLQDAIKLNQEVASADDFAEARKAFTTIVEAYPSYDGPAFGDDTPENVRGLWSIVAQSQLAIGDLLSREGRLSESIPEYKKVLDRYPMDRNTAIRAQVALARAYELDGNWAEAEKAYRSLVEEYTPVITDARDMNWVILEAPLKIAERYRTTGDTVAAARQLTEARAYYLGLAEKYPQTLTSIAALQHRAASFEVERKYKETAQAYRRLADEYGGPDARRAPVWVKLGEIYGDPLARPDSARACFRRVLTEAPESPEAGRAHLALGRLALRDRDRERALAEFRAAEEAAAAPPGLRPEAQLQVARVLELDDNWEDAATEYRAVAARYPATLQAMEALFRIGDHYLITGSMTDADRSFQEAIARYAELQETYPNSPIALAAMDYTCRVWLKRERWAEAVDALEKFGESYRSSPLAAAALWQAAQLAENQLKQIDRAKDLYQRCVSYYEGSELETRARKELERLGS